jgi:acetyl esterase/lipase
MRKMSRGPVRFVALAGSGILAVACTTPRTLNAPQAAPFRSITTERSQPFGWPSPGHVQVPVWPGTPPDARPVGAPEDATRTVTDELVAGGPWVLIGKVARPTMTVYSPQGKNTGAAVVVFPGGGYHILAIDLEGTEVCDWLTSRGVTCVLLKYRVPGEGLEPASGPYPDSPMALEDAQRTLGLVRAHAREWRINPDKVGVLGFSAGGHLVAAASTHFERVYAPVDDADKESCRPDCAVALYPGHLNFDPKVLELNPRVPVTKQTPPTFIVQAEDDPVDDVENSLVYFEALRNAGVPVEMHIFPHGGHAFGLRPRAEFPITRWPQLVESWLQTMRVTSD